MNWLRLIFLRTAIAIIGQTIGKTAALSMSSMHDRTSFHMFLVECSGSLVTSQDPLPGRLGACCSASRILRR